MMTRTDVLNDYLQIREIGRTVNRSLSRKLTQEVLHEGARKLGMLQDGVLVLESQAMSSVLMDYCIYYVFQDGLNAFERYLKQFPPHPNSEAMAFFQSQRGGYYSLVSILELEPGVGAHVMDLFRDEEGFVVDVNMSRTMSPEMLLAGRIVPRDGYLMTGGASLPLYMGAFNKLVRDLQLRFGPAPDWTRITRAQEADMAAMVIRACLEFGREVRMKCAPQGEETFPTAPEPQRTRASGERTGRVVTRNAPCPCLSGRKYKACCGRGSW